MMRLTYHEPTPMSRSELQEAFSSDDSQRVAYAMVSAAFFESNWAWAEGQFLHFASNAAPEIRALAATCLGHLARIHHQLHLDIVLPVLQALKADPATSGAAEDAIADLKIFLR